MMRLVAQILLLAVVPVSPGIALAGDRPTSDKESAETLREGSAQGGEVSGHDRLDLLEREPCDHGQADRPAADDDRRVAGADAAPRDRVNPDGHWLGEGSMLRR